MHLSRREAMKETEEDSQAKAMVAPIKSRMAPTMERTNPVRVQAQNLNGSEAKEEEVSFDT